MAKPSLLCHLVELSDFGSHIHNFVNFLLNYTTICQCVLKMGQIPAQEVNHKF